MLYQNLENLSLSTLVDLMLQATNEYRLMLREGESKERLSIKQEEIKQLQAAINSYSPKDPVA